MTNRAFAAYLAEAGVWEASAIIKLDKGENGSAVIDLFFGLVLPAIHGVGLANWGIRASDEVVVSTATKVAGKTPEELQLLMSKSTTEGGLNALEKQYVENVSKLPKETMANMTKSVIGKANAFIKQKGVKILNNPVIKQTVELVQKSSVGAYVKQKWYRWIPTVFAHDMVFIHIVDNIAKRFGLINESVIKELTVGYSQLKTPQDKQKFMDKASEVLKTTNNMQEFETKLKNGELNVTKLDTSGIVRDMKTGAIKPKSGYDSPNFYDSLDNVKKY